MSGEGAHPNDIDIHGKTALIYAVENNNDIEVKRLIDEGVDVNETDDQGKTALFYAVQNDNESVVCALIDAGADVEVPDDEGKTALFYAAANKSMEDAATCILHALIEKGSAFVNARDVYGRTPLFYAITKSTTVARYLIDNDGDLYAEDNCNVSILSFLIEDCLMKQGCQSTSDFLSEAFQLLIEKGLKRQSISQTIINLVFCKVPLLVTSVESETIQMYLSSPENVYKALAVANQYVDQSDDEKKQNILMIKENITNGNVSEALLLLVELGANLNTADSDGNTVLHYAALLPLLGVSQETIMEIFDQLKKIGVHFNKKTTKTKHLFCFACLKIIGNL
jgi:ankyrin repeat protein